MQGVGECGFDPWLGNQDSICQVVRPINKQIIKVTRFSSLSKALLLRNLVRKERHQKM